jgi:hypothetical protein
MDWNGEHLDRQPTGQSKLAWRDVAKRARHRGEGIPAFECKAVLDKV